MKNLKKVLLLIWLIIFSLSLLPGTSSAITIISVPPGPPKDLPAFPTTHVSVESSLQSRPGSNQSLFEIFSTVSNISEFGFTVSILGYNVSDLRNISDEEYFLLMLQDPPSLNDVVTYEYQYDKELANLPIVLNPNDSIELKLGNIAPILTPPKGSEVSFTPEVFIRIADRNDTAVFSNTVTTTTVPIPSMAIPFLLGLLIIFIDSGVRRTPSDLQM